MLRNIIVHSAPCKRAFNEAKIFCLNKHNPAPFPQFLYPPGPKAIDMTIKQPTMNMSGTTTNPVRVPNFSALFPVACPWIDNPIPKMDARLKPRSGCIRGINAYNNHNMKYGEKKPNQ